MNDLSSQKIKNEIANFLVKMSEIQQSENLLKEYLNKTASLEKTILDDYDKFIVELNDKIKENQNTLKEVANNLSAVICEEIKENQNTLKEVANNLSTVICEEIKENQNSLKKLSNNLNYENKEKFNNEFQLYKDKTENELINCKNKVDYYVSQQQQINDYTSIKFNDIIEEFNSMLNLIDNDFVTHIKSFTIELKTIEKHLQDLINVQENSMKNLTAKIIEEYNSLNSKQERMINRNFLFLIICVISSLITLFFIIL